MLNTVILAIPLVVIGMAFILTSLPPKIKPFTPEELRETAEYHSRINRKGVFNSPLHAPVISVGRAQEKRILIMGPRRWA